VKALTLHQPWAWLVFHGKSVENRTWPTHYRGPLAIHAAKAMTSREYQEAVDFVCGFNPSLAYRIPTPDVLIRGAFIGMVALVGCVTEHSSPFFNGPYGWVLAEPQEFANPILAKGALGLWEWSK
jgi:hypothetical protein